MRTLKLLNSRDTYLKGVWNMDRQVKLIIWDLDDTLWEGTFSEDGASVRINQGRFDVIKSLNAQGVVNSICSKNDFRAISEYMQSEQLWDLFVFPHVDWLPKGRAVKGIIESMNLRAQNVVFIDDNHLNMKEVEYFSPGVLCLDALDPETDVYLKSVVDATSHVTESRVDRYRLLEEKFRDSQNFGSNLDFLRTCGIKVCVTRRLENLRFAERIFDLVNRSNQLNYTKSRYPDIESLREDISDTVTYESFSIFVRDKYGDHGLVGFALVHLKEGVQHFVFSCRIMNMQVEDYVADFLKSYYSRTPYTQAKLNISQFDLPGLDTSFISPMSREEFKIAVGGVEDGSADSPPDISIMANCQSGIIKHYMRAEGFSDHADAWPDVFKISEWRTYRHLDTSKVFVYGMFTDFRPTDSDSETRDKIDSLLEFSRYLAQERRLLILIIPAYLEASARLIDGLAGSPVKFVKMSQLCKDDRFIDERHLDRAGWRELALHIREIALEFLLTQP